MRTRLKSPFVVVGVYSFVFLYFSAYFVCAQREEYMFDGQFRSFIPEGSLHRVVSYRYFDDSHFVVTRIFQPAHTIDVVIQRHYWSKPDNQ